MSIIKINSGNLKDLSSKGINPKTIELLEGIRKTGGIVKNKTDLEKIGITKDEIDKITPNISFAEPEPVQIIKTAIIETDLKGLTGYSLLVRNQNKDNLEPIDDVYSINSSDKTQIKYDDKVASDNFILMVKSPNGEFVFLDSGSGKATFSQIQKAKLDGTKLKITPLTSIKTNPNKPIIPSKLKGRILSNNPSRKLEKIQLVIEVAIIDSATDADYFPICYAVSEQDGYFFTSQIQFDEFENLKSARAKLGLLGSTPINIRLEDIVVMTAPSFGGAPAQTKTIKSLPEKVILYISESDPKELGESDCDCDCKDLDFHEKKALDEFSFYTVVRTTEPLIDAFEITDVEEINLEDIVDDDPEIRTIVSGIKAPKSILSSFISKHGNITKANVGSLINESKAHALRIRIFQPPKRKKGRIDLDGTNGVDWDDKPTIYQATTIAHGHLLNFKQEWFNNGYTIGDLIYSLPLAPGQKKQIVVFDWDRKDSASNTQQLDYQESLYNSLSRDRDVNEVARATLKEHSEGESESSTWGWGVGGGVGAIIPIQVPIGALVGAGGGAGGGSSSASQSSSRTTTAKSHQHISDRTLQSANSIRSQRSTVIQTVSQGERFQASAEVIANYNHCHAMTIQYFEVLRHFEIRTKLSDVQECLFIPLSITPFDRKKALRWRDILFRCLKKPFLRPGFDALERIDEELESPRENYYDELGIPKDRYAEEELEYIEGELYLEFQLTRPKNNDADEFIAENWNHFAPFIGNPLEFYTTFIRHEQGKDEAFAKHAGPRIAEAIFDEIRFFAVKNGQSISSRRLPVDATLLSDFKNKKRLNVSLRMSGPMVAGIKREDIDYVRISLDGATKRSETLRRLENEEFLKIIIHSGSMRYRTKSLHEFLFRDSNIKNDLTLDGDDVRVFTPLSAKALKKPRLEDVEVSNSLLHHLNENLEYYHQCIWSKMNAQRRFMLLDGLIAPGKGNGRSVASVVENKLVGIVGNCLVMPVAPGFQLDPTLDDAIDLFEHYYENPKDPVHVSLPTKGVFAEAVMGKCNSCEKKDESRFWRWEESPIPDSPTTINPFTLPTPQNIQPNNLQPKDFPAPIINLQNGPALPDPQGFGSLVTLLSNPNLFKDITGLTENQKNALAALQGAFGTAQFFGGQAANLTGQAGDLFLKKQALEAKQNAFDQIKKAKENGLITEKQAQDLTEETFKSILNQSDSIALKTADDIAKVEQKVKDKSLSNKEGDEAKKAIKEEGNVELDKKKAEVEKTKAVAKSLERSSAAPISELSFEAGSDKLKVSNGVVLASTSDNISYDYQFGLTDSVGLNATNLKHDVITVKERFCSLGFDWITINDTIDNETIDVIKLFQSIVRGRQSINADGKIDVPGTTYHWLNSDNAPNWLSLDDGSKTDKTLGYYNATKIDDNDDHYFGTNWLIDTIKLAGSIYYETYLKSNSNSSVIFINELAKPKGGKYSPHTTHQTGLNADIRLPRTDGGSGGVNYNDPLYDQDACRAILMAFNSCPLIKAVRFNDPELINEGLCKYLKKHDDHMHIELLTPEIGNALIFSVPKSFNHFI
jgi:hypothetical protein